MDMATRSAIGRHIEEKLMAYWHDVDFHWGEQAAGHYTEDGIFDGKSVRYVGREQIAAFYAWRKSRGDRTNVHLVNNFFCTLESETKANVNWICLLYARDGAAPQPSAPPIAITLVKDVFVLDPASGEWLCAHRNWNSLFEGDVPTTRMSEEQMKQALAKGS